jgi:hypothetical protein
VEASNFEGKAAHSGERRDISPDRASNVEAKAVHSNDRDGIADFAA